ncbi:hypothetical protein ACHAXT_001930 [Thalassiosira profunda]
MPKVHFVSRKFLKRQGVKNPPRAVEQIETHLRRNSDYFRFPSERKNEDVNPTSVVGVARSSPDGDNDSSSGNDEHPKETTVANSGGTNASTGLHPAEIAQFDADSKKEVLRQIQDMEPPGRFLQLNNSTYGWDVV